MRIRKRRRRCYPEGSLLDCLSQPKNTCGGDNVNPPLQFENVPVLTKSIALLFDDLDAPRGSHAHWILWNIDPHKKEIKENAVLEGAAQGMNDFKRHPYGGPCPPKRAHRYIFKIYVLDSPLKLNSNSTKTDLEKAMKGRLLAQAQWTGVYKRVGPPK